MFSARLDRLSQQIGQGEVTGHEQVIRRFGLTGGPDADDSSS